MGKHSFDVGRDNFHKVVIEGSKKVPMVVDFWAEWCGPCRMLKPILEKLAEEYQGKFILAKVNADQNPDLAARYGVRGIPSVKAIIDGQVVDEFSGAIPESAVREFLERIIPSPAEELRRQAADRRAAKDLNGALALLTEASKLDAANEEVRLDAAEILLELGRTEEAGELLNRLSPLARTQSRAQQLIAKLTFRRAAEAGYDEQSLRAKIAADPNDMASRLELANWLVAAGRHAEGMDELLEMIRRDRYWNDEAARKTMLSVFNLLGASPLVSEYRRKLASALN